MKTHVSYDGYLQRVRHVYKHGDALPGGLSFVSYGRLVNPKGNYQDAPVVSLFQYSDGFVAVH
jgi:hypothetical protein